MKGLIRKDLLLLALSGRVVLVSLAVFIMVFMTAGTGAVAAILPVVMALMLTISLFAYDAQAKWDQFATVLPVGAKQIVGARYLIAYGVLICAAFLAFLLNIAGKLRSGQAGMAIAPIVLESALVSAAVSLALAIIMPLIYRFGVEKARIAMLVVFLAPTVFFQLLGAKMKVPTVDERALAPVLIVAALVAAFLSYVVSCRIYQAKDQYA
jgi:hypothetical protein